MQIEQVYLVNFQHSVKEIFKLNLDNEDLNKFSKKIVMESENRLSKYENDDNENIFKVPSRLVIDEVDDQNPYNFLFDLVSECSNAEILESLDVIGKTFNPNIALYRGNNENVVFYYICELKQKWFLQDLTYFWTFKVRTGSKDNVKVKIEEITQAIVLPQKEFIAKVDPENRKVILFKVAKVNKLFKMNDLIVKSAKGKIKAFTEKTDNQLKLTQDGLMVSFLNEKEIYNILEENILLSSALSRFTGRKNSKINTISKERLEEVLNYITEYSKRHKDRFTPDQIPKIVNNKLVVDGYSLKLFVSLIGNRIIEKLLDEQIEMPEYE